jgi:hypothetical protein
MYTLIRSIPLREFVLEQVPALGTSILIAEFFYKFHSFTLECLAFLATWGLLDAAVKILRRWVHPEIAVRQHYDLLSL